MKKLWRVFLIALTILVALVTVGLGAVYAVSEYRMTQTHDVPLSNFVAGNADASTLAEGERLARIGGCIGCHGNAMQGRVFMDVPWLVKIVAPDLTLVAAEHTDAELERIIRRGVRRDGTTLWAMPSPMYYHLTDQDLGAIIAYIRSQEARRGPPTEIQMRLLARVGVAAGQLEPLARSIPDVERFLPDRADPLELGRYLALIACTECHGQSFRGQRETPDLRMVVAYSPEDFSRLMRDGIALGGRELDLMSDVARGRFAHFTDDEVLALHVYLSSLAASPAPQVSNRQEWP